MPDTPLTPRQIDVLAGMARGLTNAQIGAELAVGVAGIHSHIQRMGKRIGTGCRAGIVAHGYRTGILAPLPPEPRPPLRLTRRQADVLHRIAHGLTNAQIARDLHLTEDTVKRHTTRLYRRLQATGRAHAVALAYQHGLLLDAPAPPDHSTLDRTPVPIR